MNVNYFSIQLGRKATTKTQSLVLMADLCVVQIQFYFSGMSLYSPHFTTLWERLPCVYSLSSLGLTSQEKRSWEEEPGTRGACWGSPNVLRLDPDIRLLKLKMENPYWVIRFPPLRAVDLLDSILFSTLSSSILNSPSSEAIHSNLAKIYYKWKAFYWLVISFTKHTFSHRDIKK